MGVLRADRDDQPETGPESGEQGEEDRHPSNVGSGELIVELQILQLHKLHSCRGSPHDQLETILAAVDHGSFDTAARALSITPSAVSQRVKAMEQAAGRVLLQRSTPIRPTEAGEIVLRLARQVRLLDEETGRELDGGAPGAAVPTLSLAVNADSLATWFLDALVEVRRETEVVFDLHREDQDRTAALLRDGTVVAAVTAESRPVQGCASSPLGVDRYLAVAAPRLRHALPRRRPRSERATHRPARPRAAGGLRPHRRPAAGIPAPGARARAPFAAALRALLRRLRPRGRARAGLGPAAGVAGAGGAGRGPPGGAHARPPRGRHAVVAALEPAVAAARHGDRGGAACRRRAPASGDGPPDPDRCRRGRTHLRTC